MNKDVAALIQLLSDECGWPIDPEMVNRSAWKLNHDELGLNDEVDIGVEVYELRPLVTKQPWGVFFLSVNGNSRLSVTLLRRLLRGLVKKKRATAEAASRKLWDLDDLMFVCSLEEPDNITRYFAHFKETEKGLPKLMIGARWEDVQDNSEIQKEVQKLRKHLHWPDDDTNIEAWRKQWIGGFQVGHREVIKTSATLSRALARFAVVIKQNIPEIHRIEREDGPIHKLHEAFREALIKDLKLSDFADMVAQTITYGLFSARATGSKLSGIETLSECIPSTNPFLRDLFSEFASLAGDEPTDLDFDDLSLDELVEMLNHAKIDVIVQDFGAQFKGGKEDPVIHFYETFLKEYDNKLKFQRGVFYTPRPAVSFIVRSVDEQLRSEFGLKDGLADTTTWGEMAERNPEVNIPDGTSPDQVFVQILDPATGTGTFLVEVISLIHKTMFDKWKSKTKKEKQDLWNDYVPRHLLTRIYGYELLMAPYAVAHLKIGLALNQTGYQFNESQRLQIFLTNSLEPPSPLAKWIPGFLALETHAVNAVKQNQRFTVVIGNPPYSIMSANLSAPCRALVDIFRFVDGERIVEKSAIVLERTLQDDYVKFYGFATQLLLSSGTGVLGYISNNSFLESINLRGMRSCLLDTYQRIGVVDLHGDADRREVTSSGERDENIFQIKKGVSICLARRFSGELRGKGKVERADMLGAESGKRNTLSESTFLVLDSTSITARPDRYSFLAVDDKRTTEFERGLSLADLFPKNATGIETGKDSILIDFDRASLHSRMQHFGDQNLDDASVRAHYNSEKGCGRTITDLRRTILQDSEYSERFVPMTFTPLDERVVFYRTDLINVHSYKVARHLLSSRNICLIAMRQVVIGKPFTHIFVTRNVTNNRCFYSTRGKVYMFPMMLLPETEELRLELRPCPNAESRVAAQVLGSSSEGDRCGEANDELLHFVYAQLYSPSYRKRYAAQLASDYPSVFPARSVSLRQCLIRLGATLIGLHLLESSEVDDFTTSVVGSGDFQVEKVSYSAETAWLDKAQTQGFKGIPEIVWNFHIGGYQICHKWLKDRQAKGGKNPRPGRILTKDDIDHYQKIIVVLSETIRLMKEIDAVIEEHGGWPDAFDTSFEFHGSFEEDDSDLTQAKLDDF